MQAHNLHFPGSLIILVAMYLLPSLTTRMDAYDVKCLHSRVLNDKTVGLTASSAFNAPA